MQACGRRSHLRAPSAARSILTTAAAAALVLVSSPPGLVTAQPASASPEEVRKALRILDRWRGRWQVTLTTTRPEAASATSVATYQWVLGERYLQGDSGLKSDGARDLSMMTYDPLSRAYPLWIFTSSGVYFFLADGQWDEASRSMTWDSPLNLALSYRYRCEFPDPDRFHCRSVTKNWLGKVILELESVGQRLP